MNYQDLENRCTAIQAKIGELADKPKPTDADRDRLISLAAELHALEGVAAALRDDELAELRAQVAAGRTVSPAGAPRDPASTSYLAYLKTGEFANVRAQMSTTDAAGGYIVPEPLHAEIIEAVRADDPVFAGATVFTMAGDTTMVLPRKATHGVVANAAEEGVRSEQDAPTFTGPTLTARDYYSDQRCTQQVLDSVPGMEEMVLRWIFEDVQEQAGIDAVSGDGDGKIEGLFEGAASYQTVKSGAAAAISAANFLSVYFALPTRFRRSGAWLMSPTTMAAVAQMSHPAADDTLPLASNNDAGQWSLLGRPVLLADSAPDIAADAHPVFFGDLAAAYAVGVHRQTSVLRDPYTATPYVRFYGLARLGGCPWNTDAGVMLKCAANA